MKTEQDLFREFFTWLIASMGGDSAKATLLQKQFEIQIMPRTKGAGRTLSDEEYAAKFEQMKKEAPAFLHFLQSNQFPELPEKLRPFPKNPSSN